MTPKEFEERLIESLPTNRSFHEFALKNIKQLILDLIGDNTHRDYCECSEYGICKYCAQNELRTELRNIVRGEK